MYMLHFDLKTYVWTLDVRSYVAGEYMHIAMPGAVEFLPFELKHYSWAVASKETTA